jgi:lysyl-tRNA synthetase class I
VDQPLRSAYRLTYELILGVDVAPKLAPLLAAMDPSKALWLITGEPQQAS